MYLIYSVKLSIKSLAIGLLFLYFCGKGKILQHNTIIRLEQVFL